MKNSRLPAFVALTATLILAACDAVAGGNAGNPVGVGALSARTKGDGFTTGPSLAFYRVTGATFISSTGARDTCYLAGYSESTGSGTSTAPKLSAGAFVALTIGSRTDTLAKPASTADLTYRSALASGIPFTPGDSLIVKMAGDNNGFPVSTFRGKTAEAFTVTPFTIPASGPIALSWTPAHDANAAMFFTFRYVSATSTATTFNRQIACTFIDDGSGVVPERVTGEWLVATKRDYVAQRIRTILGQVDVPLSYFNIVSSFTWPTPVSP
jgi:hypothetical protein